MSSVEACLSRTAIEQPTGELRVGPERHGVVAALDSAAAEVPARADRERVRINVADPSVRVEHLPAAINADRDRPGLDFRVDAGAERVEVEIVDAACADVAADAEVLVGEEIDAGVGVPGIGVRAAGLSPCPRWPNPKRACCRWCRPRPRGRTPTLRGQRHRGWWWRPRRRCARPRRRSNTGDRPRDRSRRRRYRFRCCRKRRPLGRPSCRRYSSKPAFALPRGVVVIPKAGVDIAAIVASAEIALGGHGGRHQERGRSRQNSKSVHSCPLSKDRPQSAACWPEVVAGP